jgi:hypothetical protein
MMLFDIEVEKNLWKDVLGSPGQPANQVRVVPSIDRNNHSNTYYVS